MPLNEWTIARLVVSDHDGAVTTAKWSQRKKLLLRTSGDEPRPQGLRETTLGVDVQTVGLNAEKKTSASSRWRRLFA